MSTRLAALRQRFDDVGIDALVVTAAPNVCYLTGFTGSSGTVVVTAERAALITDSRYTERAESELDAAGAAADVDVVITRAINDALSELVDPAAVVGLEADHVSWAELDRFRDVVGEVRPTYGFVEAQRERKDADELGRIARAASIADGALATCRDALSAEPTERELAHALDDAMRHGGADRPGFDTIVASGPNAARPHHDPGDRRIRRGDLVVVDMGAEVEGYRSDMTRTFVIGPPTPRQVELLDAVRRAQAAGLATAGPDVPAAAVDRACRDHLASVGLGDSFTHGTGHGVGLVIHEGPAVNAKSTATLAPGHVITIEPGVYLRDFGGVRWEDTVAITDDGAEPLTRSPKEPIVG